MIKKSMIIRQFLALTLNAPADRRAQGGAALARAYLYGDLDTDALWEAKTALLSLLDDPAPSVRRALAEVCADSARSPRPIVVALSCDAFAVAEPILARSPVLTEADLVEAAALGDEDARAAIARRHHLTPAVSGALAEIADLPTLVALAGNPTARITGGRLLRMIERFGHEADLREALLARHDLPPEVRHAVAVALARSLSAFATERGWLGEARCERMNREVAERTALDLSAGAGAAATSRLVSYLRASHQLNAGLILRAILSGRIEFAQTAFADLSGLDHAGVARAMRDPRAVADLHEKAGLPAPLLPAMHAVLAAWRETAHTAAGGAKGAGLSRRMIEHAIAACEGWESPEIRSVVALLTRFEAEAARDEARETTRAILAQATAREAAERRRIAADAAWREALEAHRRAESGAEAPAVEPPAAGEGRTDPVGAILESLPEQILEWFRSGRDRTAVQAGPDTVFADLDAALIAEFRASRIAPVKDGIAIAA
ncbi:DUF2336 domain-containing protein [Methylobacterium sp. J-067]|uniref:DUF2336 domain-containing protein n=1 Tax=Methylobacterium sp. J-067 TaxID=2836648 RepID=UPI001FBAC838|nr:DUF2336 domain-containing protein [Methylobacterium sp. J-067]MCJ2024131.1 DUF2336 domain-containing protein [Methylobacterium sp. J-067]